MLNIRLIQPQSASLLPAKPSTRVQTKILKRQNFHRNLKFWEIKSSLPPLLPPPWLLLYHRNIFVEYLWFPNPLSFNLGLQSHTTGESIAAQPVKVCVKAATVKHLIYLSGCYKSNIFGAFMQFIVICMECVSYSSIVDLKFLRPSDDLWVQL